MTVMAVRPKAAAGKPAASPVPPAAPSRRRGFTPLTPKRQEAARSMRRLADQIQRDCPDMTAHVHVRDAARTLESGSEEAAQRHLRAAMFALTPQSLHRNGIHDDGGHVSARGAMHSVHRHLLLVKDIQDVAERNQAAIRRDSYGDLESAPSLPSSPVRPDPNAGYGPGALAQKPTQRQPGGDRALNAPNRTNSGGSDPAVADPVGPQPRGSKQFARTWDELAAVVELAAGRPKAVELVGPHGYVHGWEKVGGTPAEVVMSKHAGPAVVAPVGTLKAGDVIHARYGGKVNRATVTRVGKTFDRGGQPHAYHYVKGVDTNAATGEDAAPVSEGQFVSLMHQGRSAGYSPDLAKIAQMSRLQAASALSLPSAAKQLHRTEPYTDAEKNLIVAAQQRFRAERAAGSKRPGTFQGTDDPGRVLEFVGPKGYIHGWIFVGIPGAGQEVFHPHHGHGTVTSAKGGRVHVAFSAGHSASFPVRAQHGPGHFDRMTDDEVADEYSTGKGSRAAAALSEMERRDSADRDAKAGRVAALYAEKPKSEADRNRVYQGLVNEGQDPEEAWQHAYSTDSETMQRQAAVQQLRTQGFQGSGFDALSRDAYKQDVQRRAVAAEAATNGYMVSKAGKKAGIDPYSLFTGPESRARKYASPELKEWWDQNGRPTAADFQSSLLGRAMSGGPRGGDFYASVTWDDLASIVELSARTAQLEVTPAPRGKPGGPGLYDVAGMGHEPYLQQIVKALITKRGMPPGKAYAIARGAIRKWARGGGKVHQEVRAAAGAAEAGELAKQARAKAMHGHASTWDDVAAVVEMAMAAPVGPGRQPTAHQQHVAHQAHVAAKGQPSPAKSANASAQLRVGAGSPAGGQFAPAGSGSSGSKPMDAHQQHVAHLQHLATHGNPAQQKAAQSVLARMTAGSGKKTAGKARATSTAKTPAKARPTAGTKTAAKRTRSKTTGKAAVSRTAGTKAKVTAHAVHLAHVTHLQHLATHGNPAQRKAATAVLARLGVRP